MISRKAFETKGQDWCEKNPAGTDPLKFSSWTRDVVVKYVKNEGYWQKGKPYPVRVAGMTGFNWIISAIKVAT